MQVTSDIDRLTDRTEELVMAVSIPIFAEHVPLSLTGSKDPESALRRRTEARWPVVRDPGASGRAGAGRRSR